MSGYNNNYRNNYGCNNGRNNGRYNDRQYSPAEKRAYYRAQGYRAADDMKALPMSDEKVKASFANGYRSFDTSKLPPNKRAMRKNGK